MLVLARRPGATFSIYDSDGNEIALVKVVRVRTDGAVVIGVEAPKEITIIRDDAKESLWVFQK